VHLSIGRRLRNGKQLNNMRLTRNVASYGYVAIVAVAVVLVDLRTKPQSASHPDQLIEVLYLVVAIVLLSSVDIRIERGHLNLSGLAIGAAAILLSPLGATIVGLASALAQRHRGRWNILANAVISAAYGVFGAAVATELRAQGTLSVQARVIVLVSLTVACWILVAGGLSIRTGESIPSIVKHNFTPSFYLAFGYFALAALLVTYVLDGSPLGYLLATVVCVLALALTDTISGRRVRRVLESELSDADRHLFHSRAVEGVIHNLRNHVANAAGYLKEIDPRRLDPVDRESIETATGAANDAVTVLRSLAQGATPRVSYAVEPVDLNELITRALGMARPRARTKEVQLALRESPEEVKVRADPLLLREVITNLVNNAIDAVPVNGHVELKSGRRGNGWPYFSVVDNGPGVTDDQRHHLFEPHFTTKEGGTGLGLFMSYGIVREHQGDLLYEGNRRGAVFTVTLPPFAG
jgi:signal transduction histidine kinase